MYFATIRQNKREIIAVLRESGKELVDVNEILESNFKMSVADMNDLVSNLKDDHLECIRIYKEDAKLASIKLEDVELMAPIPYPKRNIICLGKNYIDHANEVKGLPGADDSVPRFPIYFSKIANPAIGDKAVVKSHHEITKMVDYEVELAVVIGKEGIDIKEEDAESHIFGYTIINDVSARNIQRKHMQWFKGKSLDTFCPMGPYLVHKSQIPFPVELDIKCSINGELRQNSNTKNMIFDIAGVISDFSKGVKLEVGDIIAMGTPSGVGLGFDPYKFLKSGDVMECYIEKIGYLINEIR